jgi:hypothetical protein
MELNKDVLYYNSNFTNSVVKYPDHYPQIANLYKELKGRRLDLLSPEYQGTEWKLTVFKIDVNWFNRLYLYIFYGNSSKKIVAFILRGKELDKDEAGILLNVLNEASFKAKNIKLLKENWKNISAVVDVNFDSLLGIKPAQPPRPSQPSQPSTPTIMPDLEEEAKKKRIELAIKLIFALAVLSSVVFLLIKVGGRKK